MTKRRKKTASIPDVCDVEIVSAPGAEARGPFDLLIEVPHGATREAHYLATRRRLRGDYPDELKEYFFVNTDVGAPECAVRTAELIVRKRSPACRRILILRNLIPRTFIDCNRLVEVGADDLREAGLNAALPEYVSSTADVETLNRLYDSYQELAGRAYATVCGTGGMALILHTYAPRNISIDRVDGNIVSALRAAYAPEVYGTWETRPEVDIISEADDGTRLARPGLVDSIREQYDRIGISAAENATYRLHPSTLGHRRSADYPQQVLCMEINRARLADPFSPFVEMRISDEKVTEMSAPIAAALLDELDR